MYFLAIETSCDETAAAVFTDEPKVLANVVSYETDVTSVLTKVSQGEADAGIVYTTDAETVASSVTTIAIPDALNTIAVYPIAIVKASHYHDAAAAFVTEAVSGAVQRALQKRGFLAP